MVSYDILDADIEQIYPNPLNRKFGFVVRTHETNELYFIKPSIDGHFHNENEYISHHISSLIKAPVPKGNFLKVNAQNMRKWHSYVKDREHSFDKVFIPPYNSAVFFGTKILKADHTDTIDKLKYELEKCDNRMQFFSQFPLDQFLKNPDRHIGNYFFASSNKKNFFYLIDFDRIFFGDTTWSCIDNIDDFKCFSTKGYNADLYSIVDDSSVKYIHTFATFIEHISQEDINDIIETTSHIYKRSKPYLDKILCWFEHRKVNIYEKCLANERCYSGIKNRGVFSDCR